ncbi:MAG: hypothetical protein JSV58_07200 [Candidatus Bathyarchaeota archaeon]|nr:MAG: hypothetical protein JSV58_07200 [Candidatus Bathyarchaeota archaeon]
MRKMGLKRDSSENAKHEPKPVKLLGIMKENHSAHHLMNHRATLPTSFNHEARKRELRSRLMAEFYKAQAITLVRRNYYV